MALVKQANPLVDIESQTEPEAMLSVRELDIALCSHNKAEEVQALHQAQQLTPAQLAPLLPQIVHLIEQNGQNSVGELAFAVLSTHVDQDVVAELLNFLASENPFIRNQAIELLQNSPEALAPHMQDLITHRDTDIRIFAVDILGLLPHPSVPDWLKQILQQEQHVNVMGAAIDRVTQLADPAFLPLVKQVKQRFADVPYLCFACDIAIKRLES